MTPHREHELAAPFHERVAEAPGLYFIGLIFLYGLRSHVVFCAGKDAQYLTDELLRRNAGVRSAA